MKNTKLAALLALISSAQAQSGDLIESSYTSGLVKHESFSQYDEYCTEPRIVDSGFQVLYKICNDTIPRFNKKHRGVENGANPGPPPKWYNDLDISSGGCNNGYSKNGESSKMDPKFATDYVYHGVDGYKFPKYVTKPNFLRLTRWATVGSLYGESNMQTFGFSLELTGFYLAPQTGTYTFSLAADDGASLEFRYGGICCEELHDPNKAVPPELVSTTEGINPRNKNAQVSLHTSKYTVHLTKGAYYFMRVVYFNSRSSFVLQLEVTRPDGSTTSDWSDIKQLDVEQKCPMIARPSSTSSDTSYTTTHTTYSKTSISTTTHTTNSKTSISTSLTDYYSSISRTVSSSMSTSKYDSSVSTTASIPDNDSTKLNIISDTSTYINASATRSTTADVAVTEKAPPISTQPSGDNKGCVAPVIKRTGFDTLYRSDEDTQPPWYRVDYTGHYLAPQTGYYNFTFAAEKDANLVFGEGVECCEGLQNAEFKPLIVFSRGISINNYTDPDDDTSTLSLPDYTFSVHLTRGVYYPVKAYSLNHDNSTMFLRLKYTRPDGTSSYDWSDDVKILDTSGHCPTIPSNSSSSSYASNASTYTNASITRSGSYSTMLNSSATGSKSKSVSYSTKLNITSNASTHTNASITRSGSYSTKLNSSATDSKSKSGSYSTKLNITSNTSTYTNASITRSDSYGTKLNSSATGSKSKSDSYSTKWNITSNTSTYTNASITRSTKTDIAVTSDKATTISIEPSTRSGGCAPPVVLNNGFMVIHRVCDSTHDVFDERDGGVEDGANPGSPPKAYSSLGGCNHGFSRVKGSEGAKMNPLFATYGVYRAKSEYHYPQGITEPNFWRETEWATTGNLYGKRLQTVGFSMDLEGYYLAPQTGTYTFSLRADNGASLQFGRGSRCCEDFQNSKSSLWEVVTTTGGEDPMAPRRGVTLPSSRYTVHLTKGVFYPMRVVYFSDLGPFILQVEVTRPDGTTTTDWSDVKIIDTSGHCPKIPSISSSSYYASNASTYTNSSITKSGSYSTVLISSAVGSNTSTYTNANTTTNIEPSTNTEEPKIPSIPSSYTSKAVTDITVSTTSSTRADITVTSDKVTTISTQPSKDIESCTAPVIQRTGFDTLYRSDEDTQPPWYREDYTGHYLAPQTGYYNFTFAAEKEANLVIGQGIKCCGELQNSEFKPLIVFSRGISINSYIDPDGDTSTLLLPDYTFSVYLTRGVYYPVKAYSLNHDNSTMFLRLKYTRPDGTSSYDWSDDVKILDTSGHCPKMPGIFSSSIHTSNILSDITTGTASSTSLNPSTNSGGYSAPVIKRSEFDKLHMLGKDAELPRYRVDYTGHYLAPQTGYYNFSFAAEKEANVEFGQGVKCSEELQNVTFIPLEIFPRGTFINKYVDPDNDTSTVSLPDYTFSVHFTSGVYYPIRAYSVSHESPTISLRLKYTRPDGTSSDDRSDDLKIVGTSGH